MAESKLVCTRLLLGGTVTQHQLGRGPANTCSINQYRPLKTLSSTKVILLAGCN